MPAEVIAQENGLYLALQNGLRIRTEGSMPLRVVKGVGSVDRATVASGVSLTNSAWYYDWANYSPTAGLGTVPSTPGVEYVPMMWGDWVNEVRFDIGGAPNISVSPGTRNLLGFNEPNITDQANMTAARARTLWPQLEATGCRLGSPSMSPDGSAEAWLDAFFADSGGYKPRCEFLCAHWYTEYNGGYTNLGDYLDYLYVRYGKPIWLTEVGTLSGGVAANAALMDTVTAACTTRPFVERVAWYALQVNGWANTELMSGGTLNAAGTKWASFPRILVDLPVAPGAPTVVRPSDAFGYSNTVTLNWIAPATGGVVTDYEIETSLNDGTSWVTYTTGTSTAVTQAITGLTNGTRYLFRVRAVNAGGNSAWAVSEWGCTPVADAAGQTVPTGTTQASADWALARIDKRAIGTQNFTRRWTGANVRIYHVDSGIRGTHNEFDTGRTGATIAAFTPAGLGGNPLSGGPTHGTQTASKAVGATLGVAPGADLWVLQAWPEDSWAGTRTDEALQWIIDNHPRGYPAVVTSSTTFNQGETHSQPTVINPLIATIVDDLGLLFVQCTGNTFSEPIDPLAARSGVIHVGATASNDAASDFNIFEPRVDIFAPGTAVPIADASSDTATTALDGTSYGTPMVAGVVATWLSANPTLKPLQLQDMLFANSTKGAVTGSLGGQPNRLLYSVPASIPAAPVIDDIGDLTPWAWYDFSHAASRTVAGSNITAIADRSGNSRNLAVVNTVTMGVAPTGLVTANTEGQTGHFEGTYNDGVTTNALTAIFVGRNVGGFPTYTRGIGIAKAGQGQDWQYSGSSTLISREGVYPSAYRTGNGILSTGNAEDSNWHVIISRFDGTNHTVFIDGVAQTPVASTGPFDWDQIAVLGAPYADASNRWSGLGGEAGLVARALTNTEVTALSSALLAKWNTPPAPTGPAPTQRGGSNLAQGGWNAGFPITRPDGLVASDVTVMQIVNYGSSRNWTCPGFTQVAKTSSVVSTDMHITILVGTGHSGAGTFLISPNEGGVGDWTAITVSSWIGADPDTFVVGSFFNAAPGGDSQFDVPGITLPSNARLLAMGSNGQGGQINSFSPAMTLLQTHNDHFHAHRSATAGATGITTVNTNGVAPATGWLFVHLALLPDA